WPGTIDEPGSWVDEADERNSLNLIATVNDDDDNRDGIVDNDREQSPAIVAADDDLMTFVVRELAMDFDEGTLELFAGDGLHVFTADGEQELNLPLALDLAAPSGPLAGVLDGDVKFLVEANIPVERTMVELIYSRDGKEEMRDELHLMVAQPSIKGGFTRGSVQYTEAMKLGGDWIAVREFDAEHPLTLLCPDPSGERQVYRYVEYRKKGEGSYQDGWLLNTEYFESLAEKWNA
ncbi:MAG: hypothetical protein GY794_08100, partial [bacterium]|nr:hypothetical protein [bacterium]